jgi:hypothetical protein
VGAARKGPERQAGEGGGGVGGGWAVVVGGVVWQGGMGGGWEYYVENREKKIKIYFKNIKNLIKIII